MINFGDITAIISIPVYNMKGNFSSRKSIKCSVFAGLLAISALDGFAQRNETKANDSNTPLHLLQPDYPVPYGIVKKENIVNDLNRIYSYLNAVTPTAFVDSKTGKLTFLSESILIKAPICVAFL